MLRPLVILLSLLSIGNLYAADAIATQAEQAHPVAAIVQKLASLVDEEALQEMEKIFREVVAANGVVNDEKLQQQRISMQMLVMIRRIGMLINPKSLYAPPAELAVRLLGTFVFKYRALIDTSYQSAKVTSEEANAVIKRITASKERDEIRPLLIELFTVVCQNPFGDLILEVLNDMLDIDTNVERVSELIAFMQMLTAGKVITGRQLIALYRRIPSFAAVRAPAVNGVQNFIANNRAGFQEITAQYPQAGGAINVLLAFMGDAKQDAVGFPVIFNQRSYSLNEILDLAYDGGPSNYTLLTEFLTVYPWLINIAEREFGHTILIRAIAGYIEDGNDCLKTVGWLLEHGADRLVRMNGVSLERSIRCSERELRSAKKADEEKAARCAEVLQLFNTIPHKVAPKQPVKECQILKEARRAVYGEEAAAVAATEGVGFRLQAPSASFNSRAITAPSTGYSGASSAASRGASMTAVGALRSRDMVGTDATSLRSQRSLLQAPVNSRTASAAAAAAASATSTLSDSSGDESDDSGHAGSGKVYGSDDNVYTASGASDVGLTHGYFTAGAADSDDDADDKDAIRSVGASNDHRIGGTAAPYAYAAAAPATRSDARRRSIDRSVRESSAAPSDSGTNAQQDDGACSVM